MKTMKGRFLLTLLLVTVSASGVLAGEIEEKLFRATEKRDVKEVKELLENGVNVNARSNNGNTALILAAVNGHKEIVELLIDKGADVNVKNKYERTALAMAIKEGHKDIADILTKNGAALQLKSYGEMINLYYLSDRDIWVSKHCLEGSCLALTPPPVQKNEEEELVNPPWANQPAATFCERHGGEYIIGTHDNGDQDGICRFKDSSMIMGWDYYKFFQDAK